eukprot:COSAG02_NODE_1454_length_12536_cov_347.064163_5_plen_890_part_00
MDAPSVPGAVAETTRAAEAAGDAAATEKLASFTAREISAKVEIARARYPWMTQESLEKLYYLFDRWDSDQGGTITKEEMQAQMVTYAENLFATIDRDHSGKLSWDEMKMLTRELQMTLSESELKDEWAKMNTNHDNSVDHQEFMQWWNEMESGVSMVDLFERMDANDADGLISDEEFIAAVALKLQHEDVNGLSGDQMVRMSLEKLRDDVRAIYGTAHAPSVTLHQLRKEAVLKAAERPCWCNYGGLTRADRLLPYWDAMQAFCLVYIAISLPFASAGFVEENTDPSTAWFWWELMVDCYFAIDVVLRFRVGYINEKGTLENGKWNVAMRYMRGWFLIDFVACLPVRYIEMAFDTSGGGSNLRALKVIRLVRLGKMLRLGHLKLVVKRAMMIFGVPGLWTLFRLFSLLMAVLYLAHITACVWYYIGDGVQVIDDDLVFYGWRHSETDHHGLEWTANVHWSTKYLDCLYFAVTTLTTVGYGDRSPHTDTEKWVVCAVEILGTIMFGLMAGTLTSVIAEANELQAQRDRELNELKTFLDVKGVDHDLKTEVIVAMESIHTIAETLITQEEDIMQRLPPYFRKKVTQNMYYAQIRNCPLFALAGNEVIHRLAQVLLPYLGLEGDEVIEQGNVGDGMYLVSKGQVQVHVQDPATVISQGTGRTNGGRRNIYARDMDKMLFCDGAFFGELPCLGLGDGLLRNQHIYTAKCVTVTQMCILKREDLEAIESDNPTLTGQVRGLALDRALRFGVSLERMTLTVESGRRRLSVAMDDHDTLMAVDPHIADAVCRVRVKSGGLDSSQPTNGQDDFGDLPTTPRVGASESADVQLVEARLNQRLDGLAAQLQTVIEAQARASLKIEQTSLAGAPPLVTPQPPPGAPPNRGDRISPHEGKV